MASTSRADPVLAAAAAAALHHETHSHQHGFLHHHHHQHGSEHTTITLAADGTEAAQQQHLQQKPTSGSGGGAARAQSPFASITGQSKTAAVVLGDGALVVTAAGASKDQTGTGAAAGTKAVPPGWPASGAAATCWHRLPASASWLCITA
jgi:hypothetical protein